MATKTKIAKGNTASKKKASEKATKSKVVKSKVMIELYSYQISAGKQEVDIADGIYEDDVDEARTSVFISGLDVDDLGVEGCTVDGKNFKLYIDKCERVVNYGHSFWSDFYDKSLIYSFDVNKASWCFEFEVEGKFDPKRLKLCCEDVVQPGGSNVTLVTCLFYGDERLEHVSYENNKGCYFWLFNKDKYAEIDRYDYSSGEISSLKYRPFETKVENELTHFKMSLHLNGLKELFAVVGNIEINGKMLKKTIKDYDKSLNLFKNLQQEYSRMIEEERVCGACFWAVFLRRFPNLTSKCNSLDSFDGWSICWLLGFEPELSDKFSMDKLVDVSSQYWKDCDKNKIESAWNLLIEAQPQFAKYYKKGKKGKRVK